MAQWNNPDVTQQVEDFMEPLPAAPGQPTRAIIDAVDYVAENGPATGRPIVGEVSLEPDYRAFIPLFGRHLKEIRPLGTDVRILCTFTADRTLVLLFAGSKEGEWNRWYRRAIPEAARLYRDYIEGHEPTR
jgi:hypothetical protein